MPAVSVVAESRAGLTPGSTVTPWVPNSSQGLTPTSTPRKPGEEYTDTQRWLDHLEGQCVPEITEILAQQQLLKTTLHRDGTRELELFTGPGHPPTVRILRRPDGAISRLDRAVEAESTPFQNHAEATAPIVDWVTTLLMERAWQSTAPAIRELPYLSPHCYEIGRKVRQRARELCIAHLAQPEEHRAWAPASNPGNSQPHRRANRKPRPGQFNNLARQANEIVREDIVDQRCWDLANRTMNTTRRPNRQRIGWYNIIATHQAALLPLQRTTPTVLEYYCNHLLARDVGENAGPQSPGQVVNAVQEDTKLDRAQWRYFCRLEQVLIMPWRRAEALEDLRLTAQALVQANQPDAPTEVVREVAAMSNMHRFFARQREGADQQTVSYWSEWIHLLNRYMNPASNAQTGALARLAEALMDHAARLVPWPGGSWQDLQRRAQQ